MAKKILEEYQCDGQISLFDKKEKENEKSYPIALQDYLMKKCEEVGLDTPVYCQHDYFYRTKRWTYVCPRCLGVGFVNEKIERCKGKKCGQALDWEHRPSKEEVYKE